MHATRKAQVGVTMKRDAVGILGFAGKVWTAPYGRRPFAPGCLAWLVFGGLVIALALRLAVIAAALGLFILCEALLVPVWLAAAVLDAARPLPQGLGRAEGTGALVHAGMAGASLCLIGAGWPSPASRRTAARSAPCRRRAAPSPSRAAPPWQVPLGRRLHARG